MLGSQPNSDGARGMTTGKPEDEGGKGRNPWAYLHLGLQYAVTVAACSYGGWWLDQRYNWGPWGLICCSMLGVVAATYHLIKETS